jgi:hypothetical protein
MFGRFKQAPAKFLFSELSTQAQLSSIDPRQLIVRIRRSAIGI